MIPPLPLFLNRVKSRLICFQSLKEKKIQFSLSSDLKSNNVVNSIHNFPYSVDHWIVYTVFRIIDPRLTVKETFKGLCAQQPLKLNGNSSLPCVLLKIFSLCINVRLLALEGEHISEVNPACTEVSRRFAADFNRRSKPCMWEYTKCVLKSLGSINRCT